MVFVRGQPGEAVVLTENIHDQLFLFHEAQGVAGAAVFKAAGRNVDFMLLYEGHGPYF